MEQTVELMPARQSPVLAVRSFVTMTQSHGEQSQCNLIGHNRSCRLDELLEEEGKDIHTSRQPAMIWHALGLILSLLVPLL